MKPRCFVSNKHSSLNSPVLLYYKYIPRNMSHWFLAQNMFIPFILSQYLESLLWVFCSFVLFHFNNISYDLSHCWPSHLPVLSPPPVTLAFMLGPLNLLVSQLEHLGSPAETTSLPCFNVWGPTFGKSLIATLFSSFHAFTKLAILWQHVTHLLCSLLTLVTAK